jgi:hypothetical protein
VLKTIIVLADGGDVFTVGHLLGPALLGHHLVHARPGPDLPREIKGICPDLLIIYGNGKEHTDLFAQGARGEFGCPVIYAYTTLNPGGHEGQGYVVNVGNALASRGRAREFQGLVAKLLSVKDILSST